MAPVIVPGGRQWVDLDVRFRDDGDIVTLYAAYDNTRYDPDGVQAMLDDFACVAMSMATYPDRRVDEMAI
jgi:hypothetical protein